MLLIKWMHRFLRNMLQQSPTSFRCTKSRVLNFGSIPPYLPLKSPNKTIFFLFASFRFFLLTFHCMYEASTAKLYSECFQGALKIMKRNMWEKLKTLPCICFKTVLTEIFNFLVFYVQICRDSSS